MIMDYSPKHSKLQVIGFYADLKGTMGLSMKSTSGIVSPKLVADYMHISVEEAEDWLWDCCHYKVTERQGGGFVV